jgi:hypothetical protein
LVTLRGSGTYKVSLSGSEDFQVTRPTGEDLDSAEINLVKGHDFTLTVCYAPGQNDKISLGRLSLASVANKKLLNNIPLLGQSGKPELTINGNELKSNNQIKIQSPTLKVN